jgi:hypothetical protein
LKLEIQLFEAEKFSIPIAVTILRVFSHRIIPSTIMPHAQTCWYQAKRTFSILLEVDSLPVFLFLADVPHSSACSQITLFSTINTFRVDVGRPSRLAMLILLSDGFSLMRSHSSEV